MVVGEDKKGMQRHFTHKTVAVLATALSRKDV
jgi:hypothetical protein